VNFFYRYYGPQYGLHRVGLQQDGCLYTVRRTTVIIFDKTLKILLKEHVFSSFFRELLSMNFYIFWEWPMRCAALTGKDKYFFPYNFNQSN
jgi:hypothetical protein